MVQFLEASFILLKLWRQISFQVKYYANEKNLPDFKEGFYIGINVGLVRLIRLRANHANELEYRAAFVSLMMPARNKTARQVA
jgi:hypothetical protein